MKILSADFVLSAKNAAHFPPSGWPEVAFAGRSNVGKSSLINALLNRKGLARTSNTPGRTQEINFFHINGRFAFVDLPGYGFAKVPEAVRKKWGPMIESYLRQRNRLCLVVLILDIRRDPSEEDLQMIDWMQYHHLNFLIVLTKSDKLSRNQIAVRRRRISENLGRGSKLQLINFSAKTGEGKDHLWKEIRKTLEADPDGSRKFSMNRAEEVGKK